MSNQPKWFKVGTVGDVNPLDYDGGFVFEDELLHTLDDAPIGNAAWRYRFCQWAHRKD